MPAEPRLSAGRRSLRLLVAATLVAVVGGVAIGDRLPPPDITIDDARIQQRGDRLDLITHLGGRAKDGTRFQLWFTLQAEAANDVTWRSDTVTGSFRRDAHERATVQEQVQVPPGRYRVEVWLHQKRRREFSHADHRTTSITIGGTPVPEIRPGPKGPITAGLSALVMSAETPTWLAGTIRMSNRTDRSVALDVSIGLLEAPVDGRNLLGGDVRWLRTIPVAVAADGATDVPVDLVPAPPPGSYRPIVVVRRQDQVVDRVSTGAAVAVVASSRAEHREATGDGRGPVTITDIRPSADATAGGALAVDVVLANTAPDPQRVIAWWFLDRLRAAPGEHLAQGTSQTLVLRPGERRALVLTGTAAGPPGRHDLSVAVHAIVPETGRRVPVDQAWVPGGIVIGAP